jgi:[ribosomal protein S18]-alanine N-acetyltransferase
VQSSEVLVREAQPADLSSIIALNTAAGTSARWSDAHFRELLGKHAHHRLALVAQQDSQVIAFLIAVDSAGDWEIENVVIDRSLRRTGIAAKLLKAVLDVIRAKGASKVLLEVRASNAPAIALYRKFGFLQDGQRKAYYSNPTEDALLFSLSLKNSS